MTISERFKHHLRGSAFEHHFKICLLWLLHEQECSFYTYLPFELLVEVPVQIPVQLILELEPNLLVQNVIELEFELSRM